jgi:hypothetical protein
MFLSSWLRMRTRPGVSEARRTPKPARPRAAFRPRLEALEDRWLPSTLTVTNAKDNGRGSLRAEIAAASANDVIVFGPKLDGQTIALTTGELDITKNLTIQGPGAGQLTISGNEGTPYASRVFEVAANTTVALSGLTISNGNGWVSPSRPPGSSGGGILNHGTLTVSGCTISNNHAQAPNVVGGGIYSDGTLTISDCTVSNNSAYWSGGGIYNAGEATVSNTTVSGNQVTGGEFVDSGSLWGGGIYNAGTLTVTGGTISGNMALPGGGIYNAGTSTVSGCTISGNDGQQGGGIYNSGTMTVSGCYVQNNSAYYGGDPSAHGGGIYNAGTASALTVSNSIFSSNSPDNIFGPYTDGGGNTFL